LAPSIGNIHGDYGPRGPELNLGRLGNITVQCKGRVQIALHGTNDFKPELVQNCIKAGVNKINVNKLLLEGWNEFMKENINKPLTQLMGEGIVLLQSEVERWIGIVGSSGRAASM
jgi:fructose-bisphosphate aldolase, class II